MNSFRIWLTTRKQVLYLMGTLLHTLILLFLLDTKLSGAACGKFTQVPNQQGSPQVAPEDFVQLTTSERAWLDDMVKLDIELDGGCFYLYDRLNRELVDYFDVEGKFNEQLSKIIDSMGW